MKNLIKTLLLVVATLLFVSCKKEKPQPNVPLKSGFSISGAFATEAGKQNDYYVMTYQLSDGMSSYYWLNDTLSNLQWTMFSSDEPLRIEVFSTNNPQQYIYFGELVVNQDSTMTITPYTNSEIEVKVINQYIYIK